HDHCSSVPTDQAFDSTLEVWTAGHQRLIVSSNGVDIRGVGGEGDFDAVFGRVQGELSQQATNFCRTAALEHIIKRIEPLARFDGVEIRCVFGGYMSHGSSFLVPGPLLTETPVVELLGRPRFEL